MFDVIFAMNVSNSLLMRHATIFVTAVVGSHVLKMSFLIYRL